MAVVVVVKGTNGAGGPLPGLPSCGGYRSPTVRAIHLRVRFDVIATDGAGRLAKTGNHCRGFKSATDSKWSCQVLKRVCLRW